MKFEDSFLTSALRLIGLLNLVGAAAGVVSWVGSSGKTGGGLILAGIFGCLFCLAIAEVLSLLGEILFNLKRPEAEPQLQRSEDAYQKWESQRKTIAPSTPA